MRLPYRSPPSQNSSEQPATSVRHDCPPGIRTADCRAGLRVATALHRAAPLCFRLWYLLVLMKVGVPPPAPFCITLSSASAP